MARLAALRELELLDSRRHVEFERIARLVSGLLDAPISLVTLVDIDRQIFIGQQGLEGDVAQARETPLSHSLCQYATSQQRPLVVGDTRQDPLLKDNLAVDELSVAAYAGHPLVLEGGAAVGALCAIDTEPREWSEADLELLREFAAVVAGILELRAALVARGLRDRLTGLPNRELLVSCCENFLARTNGDESVAVLCAGIDHFNMINQAFGADNADHVLEAVANRLQGAAREHDVFGRLRGDVFAIVAPGISEEAEALKIATDIHDTLSGEPLKVNGEPLSVGVTVGIATGRADSHGADVVSEAANAMREAKRRRGRVHIAESGWTESAAAQLRIREALHGALDRGEIGVVFQPIVELEGGLITGFETLARWTHPQLGEVSPEEFIPLAELTSDILPIGRWIIAQAAQLAAEASQASGRPIRASINASPLQIDQEDFPEAVRETFAACGLDGRHVGIEITEGVLLESGATQEANLESIIEAGASVLLDDFGTGYSGFGYLQDFPVDALKIDRSFVSSLSDDQHSTALVQAIVAMARAMEVDVVAEGIETEEQAKFLRLLGCGYGQGYWFGRPLPPDEAVELARPPTRSLAE